MNIIFPHLSNVTKHYSLIDFFIGELVFLSEFCVVFPQELSVSFLRIGIIIKFLWQRSCMHHTLLLLDIFCICCDVNYCRVMLRKFSFEICLFPFEFFLLILISYILLSWVWWTVGLLRLSRKSKELKMNSFQEVKGTVWGAWVYFLRMICILNKTFIITSISSLFNFWAILISAIKKRKNFDDLGVSIIVSAEEAIKLSF